MKLKKPNCLEREISNLSSFCFCLYHVLPYLSTKEYSYDEIMGYSGHAFHINIQVETVNKWGPTMYDWGGMFKQGLSNIGFDFKAVGYSGYHMGIPNVLNDAVDLIKVSIQRGVPLIMWEPLSPEFGIIYGYNDEHQLLHVIDATKEGEIRYDKMGRGEDTPEFFVMVLTDVFKQSDMERVVSTLDLILKYGLVDSHDFWEFNSGLSAYDAWIEVFLKRQIDVYGNAFNIQVIKNARETAIRFLNQFKHSFKEVEQINWVEKAITSYEQVADLYKNLDNLFPFPQGGYPNEIENSNAAIEVLKEIKKSEESALLTLKQLRGSFIAS